MKYVVVQLQMFSPFLLLEFFDQNYTCEGREEKEVERRREGGRQEGEKEGKGWGREKANVFQSRRKGFSPQFSSISTCPWMRTLKEVCVCSLLILAQLSCKSHSISILTCSVSMYILHNHAVAKKNVL